MRSRPVSAGYLRAFEAVARHLNFRAAGEELGLTQPAVSRQIQALEDEVGVALLLRHTRTVDLTGAGAQLLLAVQQTLPRLDDTVRQIRQGASRKSVGLTTFASFASLWLIPRLESFRRDHPDVDIRIDATDALLDLEVADVDIALRYGRDATMPGNAVRLFGEYLTPMASPSLLGAHPPVKEPKDIGQFTLIEAGDAHPIYVEWLAWRRWFGAQGLTKVEPRGWLYFNFDYQMVQAAISGHGVILARSALVSEARANGSLVELLPGHRVESPVSYWLIPGTKSATRPEVQDFREWLLQEAAKTRQAFLGASPSSGPASDST